MLPKGRADCERRQVCARRPGPGATCRGGQQRDTEVQVADRSQLMENASAAFPNAVRRSMRVIRTAIGDTSRL
jgi:hypothetical protein